MCPFCIGAAAWAAAGVLSAGGLGVLAAVTTGRRGVERAGEGSPAREDGETSQPPRRD
jgi:hypothetical protein